MGTSFTREYTTFVTATADKILKRKFEDVITRASPILMWFMNDDGTVGRGPTRGRKGGGTSRYVSGVTGNLFEEPLMTELSDTPKWYDGTETIDAVEEEVGTAAFFEPKSFMGSITISGKDKRRNAGKEKTIDMLEARTDMVLATMKNDFATAICQANVNSKAILGIPDMLPSDRGVGAAYGKITANLTTRPWWACVRSRTSGGTDGDVGDFDANFRQYGKRCFHDCSEGADKPDLHFCTQEAYERYDDLTIGYQRVVSRKMMDLGMDDVLTFMGQPVLWDRKHPDARQTSQRWYMINSSHVYLRYSPEANFTPLGFQRPANGDFITTPVIWEGALTCDNRRVQGVMTGITGLA